MSERPHRSSATWAIPLAIYVVAATAYVLLGTQHEIPLIFPDELTYGHLARSMAAGDGLSWYGVDQSWPMALYIYLLVPSWLLASGESAYELAKITSALAACTLVVPVWMLARRLMTPSRAAVPAVLAVSGTWMLISAGLLTENLALPLSTAALAASALALRDWESRWRFAALAFAVLATGARAQMGVLFAVMLAALALDAWWTGDWRERLEQRRVEALVLGVIVLAGIAVFFSGSTSALGIYAEVSDLGPSAGDLPAAIGKQWIALAAMSGVLPLAALLVLAVERTAWRDRDIGALLCVTVPAVVLLIFESAYFNAGFPGLEWGIERYVVYAVPLMLVTLVAGLDRAMLPWRRLGLAGAGVAVTLFAAPDVRQAVEQRAWYATTKLVDGIFGLSGGAALGFAALLVAGLATLIVARTSPARAVLAVGALLLLAFLVQAQWIWRWQIDFTQQIRAQYPPSLSWVDDNAGGPVTRVYTYQNSYLFQRAELFNESVEQSLIPAQRGAERPPLGPSCVWGVDERGLLQVAPGCGTVRRRIWNDDAYVQMSFHGGKVLARDRFLGQLIAVPANPRVRSIIRMPCQRATLKLGRDNTPQGIPKDLECPPDMTVFLWVDGPGTLELTFRGGTRPQKVSFKDRTWTIAPGRSTIVRVPVDTGTPNVTLATGWDRRAGAALVDAAFVSDGERAALL